jgi:hypothetical protein
MKAVRSHVYVKRVTAEVRRNSAWLETINRIMPMPFEERRGRVGMVSYAHWKWMRLLPFVAIPAIGIGTILETRSIPQEHVFTALHLWLADHGVFRHDSVKALNPAYEDERRQIEWKSTDRKWRFTGLDSPSEREIKEFAALNIERQRTINDIVYK